MKETSEERNAEGWYKITTTLGDVYCGKREASSNKSLFSSTLSCHRNVANRPAPVNVEEFWSLEAIGIKDSPAVKDNDLALKQFYSTLTKKGQRYYVSWPFKEGTITELTDNYGFCYVRLKSTIKRLKNNYELLEKYDEILRDQKSKGIIKEISPKTDSNIICLTIPLLLRQKQRLKYVSCTMPHQKTERNSKV